MKKLILLAALCLGCGDGIDYEARRNLSDWEAVSRLNTMSVEERISEARWDAYVWSGVVVGVVVLTAAIILLPPPR